MSFFKRLFEGGDSLESRMTRGYATMFREMGANPTDATTSAQEFVAKAKQTVAQRGWSNQGPDFGYVLLSRESTNPKIAAGLQALRQLGVRDEDVVWWWNMPPLERVLLEQADEINCNAAFLHLLRQGRSTEDASKEVFKAQPKFGDIVEGSDEDGPIPIELKRRIVEWSERQAITPAKFKAMMDGATSMNALIRSEIRAGNL